MRHDAGTATTMAAPSRRTGVGRNVGLALGLSLAIALAWPTFVPTVANDPSLMLILAMVPFLPLLFRQAVVAVLLFVCFSFFRLHEAYPILLPLKLPLLLSAIAFGAALVALLGSDEGRGSRWFNAVLVCASLATASASIGGTDNDALGRFTSLALAISAAGAFYALFRWLGERNGSEWGLEMKAMVAFIIIVTLGLPLAQNTVDARSLWLSTYWKIGFVCVLLAWLLRQRQDFAISTWFLVVSGCLIALVAIYNRIYEIELVEGTRVSIGRLLYVTEDDLASGDFWRILQGRSSLGDPNDLALVLLFPLGFAVGMLFQNGWRHLAGIFGLVAAVLLMTAIVFTQSRGGALGILIVLAVFGARLIKSRTIVFALGAVALVGLAVAMDLRGRQSGGAAEVGASGIDESSMGRVVAWTAATNMALSYPIHGVGLGNFPEQFSTYSGGWFEKRKAVHSTWFGVLAETGIPGLAAFVTMLAASWIALGRAIDRLGRIRPDAFLIWYGLSLRAGLASLVTAGSFLTQGFTFPLYIIVAMSAAFSRHVFSLEEPTSANDSADDATAPAVRT